MVIDKDLSHDELTDLLMHYFPAVFATIDAQAASKPGNGKSKTLRAPYLLCSKVGKGGFQPLENRFPDGAAVAELFNRSKGNFKQRQVIFGTC